MRFRLPVATRYIFRFYLLGILFFTFFRVVLLYINKAQLETIPDKYSIVAQTMLMGWRFDTVISGYILALPFLVLIVAEFAGWLRKGLLLGIHSFICALYIIVFFGCAADIPFFQNFNTRLNITALNWTSSPMFMIKMILEEWDFLEYFILFILLSVGFVWLASKIYKRYKNNLVATPGTKHFSIAKLGITIVFAALMFLGIRGRIEEKSPILVGTAYFSQYDLPNKAGLNPLFTFINSWLDGMKEENKQLKLLPDADALKLAQSYLGIDKPKYAEYPIARTVSDSIAPNNYNVVLVIMESMSANFMARYGDSRGLTPFLDSLAGQSYCFDRFYSTGIHTFNGIFSTLYSFPGLLGKHTMADAVIPDYTGLPYTLKNNGYQTVYFTTHDEQFDNAGGFLAANHMQRIVGLKDYPSDAVLSTLGVSDQFLFDFATPLLNEYHGKGKPFFATFMTTSNHPPYTIPDNSPITPKHKEVRGGCVEYADYALRHFMSIAKQQSWYRNTIFVFVGDHGSPEPDNIGGLNYAYNHVPCIMYSPAFKDAPKAINKPAEQLDIFPTIAGLLHLSYTNNTMGMDALNEKRPYVYFSDDHHVAVADSTSLYLWENDRGEGYYEFANREKNDIANHKGKADSMKQYAFSMLQTTQWMLLNGKTGIPGK